MRPWLCLIFVLSGLLLVHAEDGLIPEVHRSTQGTMEISFKGKSDSHYLLYRSLDLAEQGDAIAMTLGEDGAIHLKDRLHPTPKQVYYRVHEVPNTESGDTDGDGKLDYNEMRPTIFAPNVPSGNPFSPIKNLKSRDGSYLLSKELWDDFSVRQGARGITDVLTGQSFIKFVGMPFYEAGPLVAFMNTKRHNIHGDFLPVLASTYKVPNTGELRGEMALITDDAGQDWYVYNLQPQNAPSFEHIRLLYHLLTANMPFIDGNLAYRPLDSTLLVYQRDKHLYDREGIPIWLDEDDRPGFNDYVPLNEGETYGLLRVFDSDERPSILDVALYRQLPNDVPLLRGIITETPQTPLSHVNLRAVQNHNPNAYIRDASNHPDIKPLIGKYVRYAVKPDGFEISEVTLEEVEAQLEALRPKEPQLPPRDLEQQEILALESLGFASSSSIGAKAANLAELMTSKIGIPRVVFPEMGYAIPFHYYDAFMKHNGFYETAASMISTAGFLEDPLRRDKALNDFQQTIKKGEMPTWMLEKLTEVQRVFPLGQGIRCRSSTNNEDLPGFNGAGLYESFTHHPDEGHLSKSVKQVFASLWRFLAFEHREFYRVDHFQAAMGVLLHPNYEEEQANGVAVSRHEFGDIARHPYYANSQVGENLVTNPGIFSQPEELLLSDQTQGGGGFTLDPIRISSSNQVPLGEQVLTDAEGEKLAGYLRRIVSHFRRLYDADTSFAMEIEYKITKDRQLLIKQARPWVN